MYVLVKYLVTAGFVVAVSELAKRSDKLGALVASLPLVTILTLIWLYVERQPAAKLSNHMSYTFWYVLPTLPMFLLFPWLLARLPFVATLLIWMGMTMLVFVIYAHIMKKFGLELM